MNFWPHVPYNCGVERTNREKKLEFYEFFFIDLTTLITKKFIIITIIINTIFFIMIIIIIYNIAIRARCCPRDQQASMHLKPNAPLTLL